jgi:hypothetical protein
MFAKKRLQKNLIGNLLHIIMIGGNDSIESYEHFDVCSKDCMRKKFEEYLEGSDTDYNTMFFEAERV